MIEKIKEFEDLKVKRDKIKKEAEEYLANRRNTMTELVSDQFRTFFRDKGFKVSDVAVTENPYAIYGETKVECITEDADSSEIMFAEYPLKVGNKIFATIIGGLQGLNQKPNIVINDNNGIDVNINMVKNEIAYYNDVLENKNYFVHYFHFLKGKDLSQVDKIQKEVTVTEVLNQLF